MTFYLQAGNIYGVPALHYKMESAQEVKKVFEYLQPDCVAVELPEVHSQLFLRAVSRLPDISLVEVEKKDGSFHYYPCEPCDPSCEALRSALEKQIPAYCIDRTVDDYPAYQDPLPDPYAITRIGLKPYYDAYLENSSLFPKDPLDQTRELHMGRRLKELSLRYDKVLFVGGMSHLMPIMESVFLSSFPPDAPSYEPSASLCTLTEESLREVMGECGWITAAYEQWRSQLAEHHLLHILDRQRMIYQLYKSAADLYSEVTGYPFRGYHLRNTMKFARNYALFHLQLMPDLYQIIAAAKGCVNHQYAYEVWLLATYYPFHTNIDNLPEKALSAKEVWSGSKKVHFHLTQKSRKGLLRHRQKDKGHLQYAPSYTSICSYPPEDLIIENFGVFLKKKGNSLLREEKSRTVPMTVSLEDGLDLRETIRRWHEKKFFVKVKARPQDSVTTVVVVFTEDSPHESSSPYEEKYPWKLSWIGENAQESDMALYATSPQQNIVGPGISRCEYGGFMMTSPRGRLYDVWDDPDYNECQTKAEVLLMAAIDYAVKPAVVYVAEKPPHARMKSFASFYGKKIIYLPLHQLSPVLLQKIRIFHVLDGHEKREIAGDYIF